MTDAPERIWAWEGDGQDGWENAYASTEAVGQRGAAEYIRLDLHEAAVAAARAEGMREAARIGSAAAIEYWTEANKPVSERKYGGKGLPGCVAAAILAAAEASK